MAALTGIAVPAICLGVFGADNFMIPSLVAMLVMFILLRPYLDDLKIDKTDGENRNEQRGQGDERMMIMTTWQGVITIIMAMLGTMLTRFLPFLLFPNRRNRRVHHLPGHRPAVCHDRPACRVLAQGVRLTSGSHGIPELLAIIAIALHIWKRNMLLSIAGGTAVYMLLVQLVFS